MFLDKLLKSSSSAISDPVSADISLVTNPSSGKRTCIYYSSWSLYERKHFPQDIPFKYVTNVFLAFSNINTDTGEIISGDEYADFEYEFKPLELSSQVKPRGIYEKFGELKMAFPHIKVSMSIGGWSNRDNFAKGLDSKSKINKFLDSAIALVRKYRLDGIDLDWEFPENKKQGELYVNIVRLLRDRLRRLEFEMGISKDAFLVTIACPAFEDKLQYFNLPEMDKYLSFWNLMTYDFAGEWSERVGYHCNLFKAGQSDLCADDAVHYFLDRKIDSTKITLGMANYGRSFTKTDGLGRVFKGVGKGSSDEEGIWNYNVIMKKFKTSEMFYDYIAECAYVYCKEKKLFIGFDNVLSVKRKAQYVNSMNLGGGMWWESCGDDYKDRGICLLSNFVEELGGQRVLDQSNNITQFAL